MNKAVKILFGSAVGIWLLSKLATSGAAAKGLENKLALMVGLPKFNLGQINIRNQSFPIEFNNVRIINQSPFGATIENLFINVQYFSKSQNRWINWIMQHKATGAFTVKAGETTQVPPIKLMLPITSDFVMDAYKGDIGNQIRVSTNFTFYGVPLTIEDDTDISAVLGLVKQFNWVIA